MKKLVTLRLEKAKLMGYADYASYVLEDRMAKNEENVYRLLNQIWTPAVAKAKEELADIQAEIKKKELTSPLKDGTGATILRKQRKQSSVWTKMKYVPILN